MVRLVYQLCACDKTILLSAYLWYHGRDGFRLINSDDARMLPAVQRSGMAQCTAFQAAVRCVESILQVRIVPPYVIRLDLHSIALVFKARSPVFRPETNSQTATFDHC